MAAGAPARGVQLAVALLADAASLADREQVGRVAEPAEAMRAVAPLLVDILVALAAVAVHLQRLRGDELARGGAGEGREVVLLARGRPFLVPAARILRLHDQHDQRERCGQSGPAAAALPRDAPVGRT